MSQWLAAIADTALSVAVAIAPLAILFVVFQLFLLKLPRGQVTELMTGTAMAAVGLFLFLLGVAVGFLPFGRLAGAALGRLDSAWLVAGIGLLLGYVTTWGEPSVRILAGQVEDASGGSIRRFMVVTAICIGVALAVAWGLLRILFGIPVLYWLVPGYTIVIVLLWLSDPEFVSIAVDSGGVATGPLANTFLLALALGASASIGGQDPVVQGFGFVALVALAPILSVMVLGLLFRVRKKE